MEDTIKSTLQEEIKTKQQNTVYTEKTEQELEDLIKRVVEHRIKWTPRNGEVRIDRIRKVKDQKILIGCSNRGEIKKEEEKLKKRQEHQIGSDKKQRPASHNKGVNFKMTDDEILDAIIKQNSEILTKKISVKDHFYLLGYESGVMVALETAAILEEYGLSGTVYLIGTSPDKFKSILKNEIKKYETDDELQIAVLKHMYKLMCGAELSLDIDETLEWNERIESCIRDLLPRVSLSAQYSRLNLMMPYHRIKQALQYEPQPPPLKSKIVLLLPNSSGNDAACEELQKYSKQPLVVHNLTLPLAQALQDLRCATYINQHLDDAVLEEYNTKNHCETYLLCADTFIRYNSQDIE
ncbi:unnamed protein product [Diatraea saccharalis]|uniref:Uncharacterized protein n=1 Tax=Diatraea saccharalis TaxID=40085 RepID=A0A9N9R8C2_9NEOP|nr:unnamed protein product [Diatraea saccharalis]